MPEPSFVRELRDSFSDKRHVQIERGAKLFKAKVLGVGMMQGMANLPKLAGRMVRSEAGRERAAEHENPFLNYSATANYAPPVYEVHPVKRALLSEAELCRAIKATISSAESQAVITTYGVRPLDGGVVSNTMRAVLEGFAEKQHQSTFTLYFAYNKGTRRQAMAVGQRTQASVKAPLHDGEDIVATREKKLMKKTFSYYNWDQVIHAFNRTSSKRITNMRANLYFIEIPPRGMTGSLHYKVLLSDAGIFGVTGASIGNKSKPTWNDSTILSVVRDPNIIGDELERIAMDIAHYGDDGEAGVNIGALRQGGTTFTVEELGDDEKHAQLRSMMTRGHRLNHAKAVSALRYYGIDPSLIGEETNAVCLYNPAGAMHFHGGLGSSNSNLKPIQAYFRKLCAKAQEGDYIFIRNCNLDPMVHDWILLAITNGANVHILGPVNKGDKRFYTNLEHVKSRVEAANLRGASGTLHFRPFVPSTNWLTKHEFDPGLQKSVVDHAKVYCYLGLRDAYRGNVKMQEGLVDALANNTLDPSLARSNKQYTRHTIIVGTYNMDGQSAYGSHEVAMCLDDPAGDLIRDYFVDPFCSSIFKTDADSLQFGADITHQKMSKAQVQEYIQERISKKID